MVMNEMHDATSQCSVPGPRLATWHAMTLPAVARIPGRLPSTMNIVLNPTIDDGSIRAAAILQTQDDLRRALAMRSSQLDNVAWLTLVQTNIGVRALGALVGDAAKYHDASARLAALIEQSRECGLVTVSEGLRAASRSQARARASELI